MSAWRHGIAAAAVVMSVAFVVLSQPAVATVRTLPGTYTCNWTAQPRGNWLSLPAYGATTLLLRSNGTYLYTPLPSRRASPAYPPGRFSRSGSTLRFRTGYLKGVSANWFPKVSQVINRPGVSLTRFRYLTYATLGRHACVK